MCNLVAGVVVPIPTFAIDDLFLYLIIIIPEPPLPPTVSVYAAPPPPEPVPLPAFLPDAIPYPLLPTVPIRVG